MPKYLVAIHHPDKFDPSTVTEETMRDIGALNKEMMAAGVRFFAGGLQPETKAKSLRAQPNGQVLITDGPYLEAKEHVGGFWILEVADLDGALSWGRKAVVACRTPVEVRPFFEMPPSNRAINSLVATSLSAAPDLVWLWDSRPQLRWRRLSKPRAQKLRRRSRIHIPSSIRNFFLR